MSYLTIEASVKIEILNGLGKVLKVIENNKLNARTYLYHCPAKSLSSGIYFMRVLINNNIKISKLVVE